MEIQGEVQNIRKDGKALQIENEWYQFFKPNKNVKKGDYVSLDYTENKGFRNIKKIAVYEKEVKEEVKQEIKPKVLDNEKKLDTTTFNTILMTAKDIKIAHLSHKVNLKYKDIIKEVMEGLKEINAY